MRIILFIAIFFLGFLSPISAQDDLVKIRNRFQNAQSQSDFQWILDLEVSENDSNVLNTINSYRAVSRSAMAQYVYNPFTKFKLFFEGRDELEMTINKGKNVENVFLRLIVQLSIPSFLGYSKDIGQDIKYLQKNLQNALIPVSTKKFIVDTLINTGNKEYDLNVLTLIEFK